MDHASPGAQLSEPIMRTSLKQRRVRTPGLQKRGFRPARPNQTEVIPSNPNQIKPKNPVKPVHPRTLCRPSFPSFAYVNRRRPISAPFLHHFLHFRPSEPLQIKELHMEIAPTGRDVRGQKSAVRISVHALSAIKQEAALPGTQPKVRYLRCLCLLLFNFRNHSTLNPQLSTRL